VAVAKVPCARAAKVKEGMMGKVFLGLGLVLGLGVASFFVTP
jgi:hypothetical protein